MTIDLLITARDAASTLSLIEIARAALADDTWRVSIHAQAPAYRFFREAGLSAIEVDLPAASEAEGRAAAALLARAEALLEEEGPTVVLVGLSTPVDGGIDEAVLARSQVPTFVTQDFWGESNAFFGRGADCSLALDEAAVRLTHLRHGAEAVAIGSPRHAPYAALDVKALRCSSRGDLGIEETSIVVGFFGQAMHFRPGYSRTVRAWAEAVGRGRESTVALYRPHPRESDADVADTLAIFAEADLETRLARQRTVEETLLACDVVCSAFSLCNFDAAYLNRFASEPMIVPLTLMLDGELAAYCRDHFHLQEFPHLSSGLGLAVREGEDLAGALGVASSPDTRERVWRAARALPDPAGAAGRALAVIRERLRSGGKA